MTQIFFVCSTYLSVNDNRRRGGFGASSIATARRSFCVSALWPGKSEQM